MGRLRFALASLALAACGLDIVGITPNVTPTSEAGVADVFVPDATEAAEAEIPDAGAGVDADAGPIEDASMGADADAAIPIRVATIVASEVSDLRSIAVTPDGNDLYVAAGAGTILHYSMTGPFPASSTPIVDADDPQDVRALAWAADLDALVYVTGNTLGRYVPAPAANFASDQHGNAGAGVDIAYANNRAGATFANKVSTYQVGPSGVITDGHDSTNGNTGTLTGVALDSQFVYWADSTNNYVGKSSATSDGTTNSFVSGLDAPTSLAVNATSIYIAQHTSIVAADITTAATTNIASGLNLPFSLVYTTNGQMPLLLWLESTGDIMLLPIGASPPLLLGTGASLNAAQRAHQHLIAVTANYAFWGNPADGTIKRAQR